MGTMQTGARARHAAWGWMLMAASMMAQAQPQAQVRTADDYARAESMLSYKLDPLVDGLLRWSAWQDDGSFAYVTSGEKGARLQRIARDGKALPEPDADALAKALEASSKLKIEPREFFTKVRGIRFDDDGSLRFSARGTSYRCASGKSWSCSKIEPVKTGSEPGTASPDGKREAFIRDWNLWVRDVATGKETQLTRDGKTDYGYATDNAGWQHGDGAVVLWSKDGQKIATFQQDQRKTSSFTMVSTKPGAPDVETWKYPFVGDEHVTMIERVIIDLHDLSAPKTIRLQMAPDQHRSTISDDIGENGKLLDAEWSADGKTLAFVSSDRGHKWAQLRVADAQTGKVRDVYRETVKTQYEAGQGETNWRYLPETNEFIWYSEQSDWGHLYLHDLTTGKRKRQITSGNWVVTQIAHLDPASRTIWFRGVGREAGRDPYFTHFYKVGIDDGKVQLLTPEDANHTIRLSDDGKFFVDTYSTIATAPVTVLRNADGASIAELVRTDLTRLKKAGWVAPESFTVKGRDGKTDLYGQLFKPTHFDAKNKYPVVVYVYPGPQTGSVRTRSFVTAHGDHQALAELGFIVVAIDGMGTPYRSKSFHDAYYGNMVDNTLPDQEGGVRQLGARYPWIDLSRVGIWGHSGGGNATAGAMFTHPDFFKVGIAESGNHDNLSYEDDWAERYHGLMVKNEDGTTNYTKQDNAAHAKNLKGKLFLIHGMMDDNVPVQNTLLVVDALVKANKDFDLLLLPHAHHGFGMDSFYVMRRRWDYFVQHLLGAQPPKEYKITPPVVD